MPISNNVLMGSSAQGGEFEIANSLRFRGDEGNGGKLRRSMGAGGASDGNRKQWTYSTWVKKSAIFESGMLLHWNNNASAFAGTEIYLLNDSNDRKIQFYEFNGSSYDFNYETTLALTDDSAWYHIVVAFDTTQSAADDRTKIWVNGQQITSWHTLARPDQNYDGYIGTADVCSIGKSDWANSNQLDGYLAETHFLHGTVKNHLDFGKYDDNGEWIPIRTSFSTTEYGDFGFYLKYDPDGVSGQSGDGSGVGGDHSGKNNHFTPSGINQTARAYYSPYLYSDNSTTYDSTNENRQFVGVTDHVAHSAFDGDDGTNARGGTGSGSGNWMYFRPPSAIACTSLVVRTAEMAELRVNGTATGDTVGISTTAVTVSNPPSSITEIAIKGTSGNNPRLYELTINGTALTDNFFNDIVKDTPTNNLSTFNFHNSRGGQASNRLRHGNLFYTSSTTENNYASYMNIAFPASGKYYLEVWMRDGALDNHNIGFSSDRIKGSQIARTDGAVPGQMSGSVGNDGFQRHYINGTNQGNYMAAWVNYLPLMVAIDADNQKYWVGQGGKWADGSGSTDQTSLTTNAELALPTGVMEHYYLGVGDSSGSFAGSFDANFGQWDFLYTPPAGYKALSAKNLPDVAVPEPEKHFKSVKYAGDGNNSTKIALDFQPDFVWIKDLNASGSDGVTNHMLYDSIRGVQKHLMTDLPGGDQSTNANGLQEFSSDGFKPGSIARTNASGQNYVAWCWKAGGAPTATNTASVGSAPTSGSVMIDGSVSTAVLEGSVQVKKLTANTTAGFSIVQYTGNGNNGATVPHGLTKNPAFILTSGINAGSTSGYTGDFGFPVYHHHGSFSGQQLYLSKQDGVASDTNVYVAQNSQPNDAAGDYTINNWGGINNNGTDYIAYIWHEVVGYSKFGLFEGNKNAEGPHINCGFKPAYVVIRISEVGGANYNWFCTDNARGCNSDMKYNELNANAAENNMQNLVNFEANGFSLSTTSDFFNRDNTEGIYWAFAEHPFGGGNVSCATAQVGNHV